jgi:hypothetical protein
MPGRAHVAAPGEPRCPAPGCERPAGFATHHEGHGRCRRHGGTADPSPTPSPAPSAAETALDRRLTGPTNPDPDPLPAMRLVLTAARTAGYPFEEAWAVAAEAALSYMTERQAREWWNALSETERAWAEAYAREESRLAALGDVAP